MSKKVKYSIIGVAVIVVVGIVALTAMKGNNKGVEVRVENVAKRDLIASVTASGQVRPHTAVDVASDISGRIVRLAIKEGQMVSKGQFLLQIEPNQYEAAVQRAEASLASARAGEAQAKASLLQAKRNYERSAEIRKSNAALISDEQLEQLKTQAEVNQALAESANHQVDQAIAQLRDARSSLSKTTIFSLNLRRPRSRTIRSRCSPVLKTWLGWSRKVSMAR